MKNHSAIAVVFAITLALAAPISAAIFIASPTGTANGDGTATNPLSLQAAVAAAENADQAVITLLPGSYSLDGSLVLNSPDIQIQGAGMGASLLINGRKS